MKDELGIIIMTAFVALRPRTWSYLTDDSDKKKKNKRAEKIVVQKKNLNLKLFKISST